MNVLGLDISTSCIGACILDEAFNIVKLTHVDFNDCGTFWDKVDVARGELTKLINAHTIDEFCVEQVLQRFSPGFSSAGTIILLAQFNAVVTSVIRDKLGKSPIYFSVNHARKICDIKLQSKAKSGGKSHKEQVVDYLIEGHLKHINFPKTKTGKLKPFVGDECDAYVIARAGIISLQK
jgi:hypothetical protein